MKLRIFASILVTILLFIGGIVILLGKGSGETQYNYGGLLLSPLSREIEEKKPEPQVAEKSEKFSIQFFGDMMLDRNVASKMGKMGLDYLFANSSTEDNVFSGSEMTFANLEGPFAKTRIKTSKEIAFRFDPVLAGQLREYGFTGFSLANNHSYDMGRKNVDFTRTVLEENNLGYFGDELKEGPSYTFFATSSTGVSVALLGIHNTYHNPDPKLIKGAILDARSKGAEVVIANVHWGEEYKLVSNKKQQTFAHSLVDLGVDLIIGHHPHVVQEMEIYKGKLILYSLGNFIFDQYFSKDTQEGLSVVVVYDGAQLSSVELVPFYGEKSQVKKMNGERKDQFLNELYKRSRLSEFNFINGKLDLNFYERAQ